MISSNIDQQVSAHGCKFICFQTGSYPMFTKWPLSRIHQIDSQPDHSGTVMSAFFNRSSSTPDDHKFAEINKHLTLGSDNHVQYCTLLKHRLEYHTTPPTNNHINLPYPLIISGIVLPHQSNPLSVSKSLLKTPSRLQSASLTVSHLRPSSTKLNLPNPPHPVRHST